MHILRVIHSVDPLGGGVVEAVKQSSQALMQRGHTLHHLSLDAPDAAPTQNYPLELTALGPGLGNYGYTSKWIPWLEKNLKNFDLVIVEGLWQYHSFGTWRVLKNQAKPYFVYPHGMLDPWFKESFPLKHLKKCLYWPWSEYHVLKHAHAVIFTAEQERLSSRQSFWPYTCNEAVIPLGIQPSTWNASESKQAFYEAFPELRGKRILLFLGRLHSKKGIDLLIDSWKQLQEEKSTLFHQQNCHLLLAGPQDAGLSLTPCAHMTLGGMLINELKWGAFHAANAFILPSHQENFGIAVVEALSTGTPVLISNQVNIHFEIKSHEAGLVEEDTPEGTLALLSQWLQLPVKHQKTMASQALSCFNICFHAGLATQQLEERLLRSL